MKILCAKIKNQSVVLRRYEKSRGINLEEEQKMLTICKNKIMTCNRIEEMIGFEGQAAKYYFKGLAACIDKEFSFQGRSRRPPRDEFNSMISLGYSILMNEVYCKIEMKGLNPYFGFIHRDAEKHPTLASDMMEEWRAVIVDATAMSMINGHEIQKEHFNFSMDEPGCYLTRDGLKIYLNKLERKFQTEVRYLKYVDYAVSFRRGIFLQVKCLNLMRLLKIDMIKKHLLSYDYHAALAVGKEIKDELNPVAWKWLQSADARAVLDWERMNRVLPENNGIISAVRQENKKKILFEYLLALDLKVKRGEYADFIRGITPLGVDLLEMVLEQYCQIDIRQYYMKNAKNGRKWSRGRMEGTEVQEIMNARYSSFNYKDVYSRHLQLVIEKKCKDDLLKQRTEELVQIEYNVRNIAAHNIVSATPEWVKEQAGRSVEDILWLLKYICEQVKINTRKENWDSYDYMNKRIIEELDR